MEKRILLLVLVIIVGGCKPSSTLPTGSATAMPISPNPSSTAGGTSVRAATSTAPPTSSPTAPTSAPIPGWSVYENDLLGYEISYPPDAEVASLGPDGYSPDNVPPDIGKSLDYFAVLESLYPDDLCVAIEYKTGFVLIKAPPSRGGEFVTCGVTGIGDYDVIHKSETTTINGQQYAATGYEARERDAAATFLREVFFVELEDGTTFNYGGSGATYEGYLSVKEILLQIVASYRMIHPPSCASEWTRLYPAVFAVVALNPHAPPSSIRSTPDTTADIVTQLSPGDIVMVLEGPICDDGSVFWRVRSSAVPDDLGWVAEGDGVDYYLVPYNP